VGEAMKFVLSGFILVSYFLSGTMLAQESANGCVSKLKNVTVLDTVDGWRMDFLDKSTILSTRIFPPSDANSVETILMGYKVKKIVITIPHIQFDSCDESAVLSYWYILPESAVGFQSRGRTFAYLIAGQLVSGSGAGYSYAGGKMNLLFTDTHGDGKFNKIHLGEGVGLLPNVPAWAR
jgi:hypothetical protein